MSSPLRIQLWSYNYDPEPTGIGPVSSAWANAMRERGHSVQVVAAHPHYPAPEWGARLLPYHETRRGLPVLRLPLWIGRSSAGARYRQELSFALAQTIAIPLLGGADAFVSVSPSFPALMPAIVDARLRRIPWVIWLQDILPDGAVSTGLVSDGILLKTARRLERAAYAAANKIVVPSYSFAENLSGKGVPDSKIDHIYNPATRTPKQQRPKRGDAGPLRVLSMGNIGYSQGLATVVRAFEDWSTDVSGNAAIVITGTGVAADEVRAEIRSRRVKMLGLVDDERLEQELARANVGLVSQRHNGVEFNVPSKIMNFMTYGLPVLAVASPDSEAARIVRESGGGWVVDSGAPHLLSETLEQIAASPDSRALRGRAAYEYAQDQFDPAKIVTRFEATIRDALALRIC